MSKRERERERERERNHRGRKKTKSGLFIFWIDRSDGMEPCVRMKAAVLLARTFLSAHMLLIPSYTTSTHTHTHTHTAHMEVKGSSWTGEG